MNADRQDPVMLKDFIKTNRDLQQSPSRQKRVCKIEIQYRLVFHKIYHNLRIVAITTRKIKDKYKDRKQTTHDNSNSQALSLYLSLIDSIPLYLWEIEIELTLYHSVKPHHQKLFNDLRVDISWVWYIIGIVSSSLSYFCTENIGLIGSLFTSPVSNRV